MTAERRPFFTSSFDLDGVIFSQIPVHVASSIESLMRKSGFGSITPYREVVRVSTERELSPLEKAALLYVKMEPPAVNIPLLMRVWPNLVHPHMEQLGVSDHRMVFNTARLFHPSWVQTTWEGLRNAGVATMFDREKSVFRPDGIDPHISKASGIREVLQDTAYIVHFEDNPPDAFAVAEVDRERVFVVLLQDLTNGMLYSHEELILHPNVLRVASLTHAITDTTVEAVMRHFVQAA